MKYIRTKDGIFEEDLTRLKINCDGSCVMEYKGKFYEPPLNVKQANTIEELCDYLMVFDNNNKISDIVEIKDRPKDLIENKLFVEHLFGYNFKLAIETDKGLIYVAKMNESGCLELL